MIALENKVALVTGATSGIGKATALALATAGAKVVFSGRRDPEGEATAALIRDAGGECLFVRSDVSSQEDVEALVQKTIATCGRLDCAFNKRKKCQNCSSTTRYQSAHYCKKQRSHYGDSYLHSRT